MIALCLLLALQAAPADPPPDHWTGLLRSEKASDRDEATRRLKSMGKAAFAFVEPLLKDPDLEVARRARDILEALTTEQGPVLLQKLEKTLLQAKSVGLTFEIRGGKAREKTLVGEVLVKEGGKVRCWMIDPRGESDIHVRLVSDGTRVLLDSGRSVRVVQSPASLTPDLLTGLARVGPLTTLTALSRETWGLPKLMKVLHPSSIGVDLAFDVDLGEHVPRYRHVLACRPEEGILLSRKVYDRQEDGDPTVDRYLGMALNREIPDEKFALPEK